jgi:hypothetical protein
MTRNALALLLLLKSDSACRSQKQRRKVMNKLTRKAACAALAAAAILVVGVSRARADEVVVTNLKVPFSFMVGDVRLPAGDYTVREASMDEDVLAIVSADGHHFALASTIPGTPDRDDKTQLVFQKFDNDYFLSRIAHEGDERQVILTPHSMEREAAKAARANN